jgi:hypothetical protein
MTYTFTEQQLNDFTNCVKSICVEELNDYAETPQEYDEFLEKTFGEDYLDYQGEGCGNLYEYEWDYDFYYGLVTGNFSPSILEWIENEKDNMKEWEENREEDLEDWD